MYHATRIQNPQAYKFALTIFNYNTDAATGAYELYQSLTQNIFKPFGDLKTLLPVVLDSLDLDYVVYRSVVTLRLDNQGNGFKRRGDYA